MSRTFSSVSSALIWYARERARADGLRAASYDPRLIGPINGPMTAREDRLLLLAVIGCCVRRLPRRYRRVLLLMVAEGMQTVELAGQLGYSDRWASALQREAREAVGAKLRRVGIVT